jgi:hypothetical protein
MAEDRNPIGYEKIWLYKSARMLSQRVKTYAEMQAQVVGRFEPCLFIVDIDEDSGGEDVMYFWSGIETRIIPQSDVVQEAESILVETIAAKDAVLATLPVTVATYADAVPLFTGSVFRRIDVLSDTAYNEGSPSFYEYNPAMPSGKKVWFLGLDPDYLTND